MITLQKWLPAPTDLLGRLRWLLLWVNLVACLLAIPLAILPATSDALARGLVGLALIGLAARSIRVYRRGPGSLLWLALEGGLFVLISLSVSNLLAIRGVMSACLSLRALYASARQTALLALVYAAVVPATAALSPPPVQGANAPPQVVTGVLTLAVVATLMYVLALSLRRADAAQAEVQRLNAELERRVRERTAQLEAANQELRDENAERAQAEASLRASEARYRTLVETSSDAIVLTDPAANVILCNEAAAALVGYPNAAALVGRCALDFVARADRERAAASLQEVLAAGRIRAVEHMVLRPDGGTVPVELSAALALDDAGQPRQLVAIVRDVTARQQAEAERRQAQALEARLDGIVLAAREVGHLLNNDLAAAIVALEILPRQVPLPAELAELIADATEGLAQAEQHVRRFQQVVRVEVKETPMGPALDLERSAPPPDY